MATAVLFGLILAGPIMLRGNVRGPGRPHKHKDPHSGSEAPKQGDSKTTVCRILMFAWHLHVPGGTGFAGKRESLCVFRLDARSCGYKNLITVA